MRNVVIAGYARSPFHPAGKGALARVRPDDLAAQVIRGLIERTGVNPAEVEDIILGCAFPEGEQGFNMARLVGLLADLPLSVGGMTVNRFCGSSMSAIHIAMGQIQLGAGEAFICAGVESMSRVPMGGYNPLPNPDLAAKSSAYMSMGETAENVATRYQITREQQEAFAVESQQRAAAASEGGRLTDEIVPIATKAGTVDKDGTLRPDTTAEALAGLKPAFDKEGSVTAGHLLAADRRGQRGAGDVGGVCPRSRGLTILARIKAVAISGCAPEVMGLGPVGASRKALERGHVDAAGQLGRGGAERSVRLPGARLHQGSRARSGQGQRRWRRHRARPSARRDRREDRRQGSGGAEAGRGPIRACHPVHRWRPGHRHPSGGSRMSEGEIKPEGAGPGAINKVCVIGAGTMGAGIAAQVANAGVPVLLLDIVRDDNDRDGVAQGAVERMLKTEPAPFMSKAAAKLVEVRNIDDHLGRVAECDWVIEAIVERLDLKQALYAKLEAVRRPGTAVSSNTSTIPLQQLTADRSDAFKRDFLVTHFFNPPRYMRLLEVVTGPDTDEALAARVQDFADRRLGKSIVPAKDTPGFIANRLGIYWIQVGLNAAFDLGLTVEEADAIAGRPMGRAQDRHLRADGPDRHRSHAASPEKHDRYAAGRRRVSRGGAGPPVDRAHDRAGADRPQGQGRLLPAQSRAQQAQGSD